MRKKVSAPIRIIRGISVLFFFEYNANDGDLVFQTPTTKLTLVVPLPPMLSVTKFFAPST